MYSSTSAFLCKCCQASSNYKALHDPWSHFIFGLWWVSLAKYLLILRVYFPLVADNTVYHGYCKHCFCPAMDEEYAMGKALLYIYSIMLLWDVITNWQVFEQWCEMLVSKLPLLPLLLHLNLGCNNFNYTPMYGEVFVNFM